MYIIDLLMNILEILILIFFITFIALFTIWMFHPRYKYESGEYLNRKKEVTNELFKKPSKLFTKGEFKKSLTEGIQRVKSNSKLFRLMLVSGYFFLFCFALYCYSVLWFY